jgi:hypothetical protein
LLRRATNARMSRSRSNMDTPEVAVARYATRIALWALYVSGGALFVSACVFALELRRWFDEGVKLSMSVMADAMLIGSGREDRNTYLSVSVTNRGSAPTSITHMVLYNYPSRSAQYIPNWLTRWMKGQRPRTSIVTNTGAPGPLPYVLQPGHNWVGMATHTPELEQMIEAGRLYVGIIGSHSDRTLFRRVRRWKPPTDAKAA